tara:strand:+ start:315 stop:812 length:498 start_codon:yes stop_codon:yes gene_type:complete
MEQRHAEKMTEMNAALSAKDAEAGSVRSKLEQAEKDAINQKEMLSTSAQKAAKEAEARVSAEIVKMKAQLDAKDKELNTVKTEVTGLRKAADQNTDAQARLKDLAKQKEALEKEKQMMVSFRKGSSAVYGERNLLLLWTFFLLVCTMYDFLILLLSKTSKQSFFY